METNSQISQKKGKVSSQSGEKDFETEESEQNSSSEFRLVWSKKIVSDQKNSRFDQK